MLHRYPFPEGEEPAQDFSMTADGQAIPLYTARVSAYPINRRWPGHQRPLDQTELASFAAFGTDGPVQIELKPQRPFREAVIRPLSRKVVPEVRDGTIRFTLPSPGKYTLELDGPHHALHLFADEIRSFDADPQDPSVLYFGPGIHEPGLIELHSNQTLFIDEGAIVHGRITAKDADHIRIIGHGILDGSRNRETYLHELNDEDRKRIQDLMAVQNAERTDTVRLDFCDHVLIDGIIIRDSLLYNIRPICCRDLSVHNVKLIGNWRYNSDGIDMHNCRNVHISDCFIRTFDDSICVKGFDYTLDPADMHHNGADYVTFEDVLIEKCVIWCDWGKTLEFGAETQAEEICRITFRDCDAIHTSFAVCDITSVDYADIHDVLYEDIRIEENPTQRPILQMEENVTFADEEDPPLSGSAICVNSFHHPEYSGSDPRPSCIHDAVFRNISVVGRRMMACIFKGAGKSCVSGPFRIENLTFNGKRVTPDDIHLEVNPYVQGTTLDGSEIRGVLKN